MHDVQKVRVELGAASYDIFLGEELSSELCAFVKTQGFSRRALILSDEKVGKIYGEETADVLRAAGLDPVLYIVPAGEASKSLAMTDEVFTCAIEAGLDRRSPVFALGGGVVGDLAGFIAAAYMRGVPFVQLPTSLLAQVHANECRDLVVAGTSSTQLATERRSGSLNEATLERGVDVFVVGSGHKRTRSDIGVQASQRIMHGGALLVGQQSDAMQLISVRMRARDVHVRQAEVEVRRHAQCSQRL